MYFLHHELDITKATKTPLSIRLSNSQCRPSINWLMQPRAFQSDFSKDKMVTTTTMMEETAWMTSYQAAP